ncbi:MAG: tetratricopeptide repeat protein [Desulfosalsimonas sp.]|uniref:tetratricopeptide repeat protein n=1 Tax=Desulfosalsimonas sp. TaxID=3073848 RepID=UPI00397093A3
MSGSISKFCSIVLIAAALLYIRPGAGLCAEPPAAAQMVLSEAYEQMEAENYEKALEKLKNFQARSDKTDPDPDAADPRGYHHPEIYFMIGNIHYAMENPEKAKQAYQQAVKRSPKHAGALVNLARVFHEQEKYEKAAQSFEKAYAAEDQKEAAYLYYAAVSLLADGSAGNSLSLFEKLLKAHPDEIKPGWRENLVYAFLEAGKNRKALPHIKLLAEKYTGEKQIQWQEILLHQYLELDMQDTAGKYALELTMQAPTLPKWWKALAHTALSQNDHDQALTAMMIYSYLTPLSEQEKKLLGDLALQAGVPVKAEPYYEALLEENQDKSVLKSLVSALQQLGKSEKALEAIRAFDGYENHPELMMLKADLLYGMDRFGDAAKAYSAAAQQKGKQEGRAWLMAGYAAWEAQDTDAALQYFKEAAEFENHKKDAKAAIQRLAQ